MAEVYPFCGVRYKKEKVSNLGVVICPPYDEITPAKQKFYYQKSDYNVIRLELPARPSADSARGRAKYGNAAMTLKGWLGEGVLQADGSPAFYLHDHYFSYQGRRRRRELIARVKLVPWGEGICPHEETSSKIKQDRLQLLRTCQAASSPILALYQGRDKEMAGIFSSVSQYNPLVELIDSGERHLIWAITEPELIHQISELLSDLPFYVADGHHRYEVALAYQRERIEQLSSPTGKEAFNYIMMSLVEFSDPGLVVLPIHRLVRGISLDARAKLKQQLLDFFTAEIIPLSNIKGDLVESLSLKLKHGEQKQMVLRVLGLESESLVVLTLRPEAALDKAMPETHSQGYKKVGVSIINHLILEQILGIPFSKSDIGYTSDVGEAYRAIAEGHYQLAFLVQSPDLGIVKAVADAGDRMPRKSTYFYPKVPAGLIINPLW